MPGLFRFRCGSLSLSWIKGKSGDIQIKKNANKIKLLNFILLNWIVLGVQRRYVTVAPRFVGQMLDHERQQENGANARVRHRQSAAKMETGELRSQQAKVKFRWSPDIFQVLATATTKINWCPKNLHARLADNNALGGGGFCFLVKNM